jgi:hypothetical protein
MNEAEIAYAPVSNGSPKERRPGAKQREPYSADIASIFAFPNSTRRE